MTDFERAHPGVHIEVQQIPLTAVHENLLTAFVGDALPIGTSYRRTRSA